MYSTIAGNTALSKSRSNCRVELSTWIIITPTIFSTGSIQKCVPNAPSQPYDPFPTRHPAATGSLITITLSPNARPGCRPGIVSGTKADAIISTVFGLSNRFPFPCPPSASICANSA